ncbi:hypothetical protein SLEP1_g4903 [Rubroshorea leprosula]|uniref:Uncharacterized protein n=1 Tax=Rubroshorea leprosula TaxID=152421 RepID=A0AAV5HUI9_9ROSI|nr:hypothetical protein SLEP1_g4903 [Rubroshorea leprosula]
MVLSRYSHDFRSPLVVGVTLAFLIPASGCNASIPDPR